jgi:hypothetical protein
MHFAIWLKEVGGPHKSVFISLIHSDPAENQLAAPTPGHIYPQCDFLLFYKLYNRKHKPDASG